MLKQKLRVILSWLRFAKLLVQSLIPTGQKVTIFMSVSGGGAGSAADLRGHAIAKALDQLGFKTIVLHASFNATQRQILFNAYQPKIIILQQTRNLHNTPALYGGVPCILDVDDADIIEQHAAERIAKVASECHSVIAGSRYLASIFSHHNKNTSVIWTGTYQTQVLTAKANASRASIIAWAPSDPFGYPDEAEFVLNVIRKLKDVPRIEFRIYGIAQEKFALAQEKFSKNLPANVSLKLMPLMRYEQFVESLAEVAIGMQPICENNPYSMGKSFGKVLAYLAADVAVVASDNIDHPLFFENGRNGVLLPMAPEQWAAACEKLLEEPRYRDKLVTAARADFLTRLTTQKVAALLSHKLHEAIASRNNHAR